MPPEAVGSAKAGTFITVGSAGTAGQAVGPPIAGQSGERLMCPRVSARPVPRRAGFGRRITLRTPATGVIGPLFKAARIALPPNVREPAPA